MNVQGLLNQFLGANPSTAPTKTSMLGQLPGGLMGGAAAGGVMALLIGNKSARKFAGKAATYGGAALLAGVAYSAYKNWQTNTTTANANQGNSPLPLAEQQFSADGTMATGFQVRLIKPMISAANADGHITPAEQRRIFESLDQMNLPAELKAPIYDALSQPDTPEQLASGIATMEQKTELYLASCLSLVAINAAEKAYLARLANAMQLPSELAQQLQISAQHTLQNAA